MLVIRGTSTNELTVRMADMQSTNHAHMQLVTHSLGSCLGITVYDPVIKVGAMMHSMLPDSNLDPDKALKAPFLFVDTGFPLLLQAAQKLGALKSRIQIKVAGGADMMESNSNFKVGTRNFDNLVSFLKKESLQLTSKHVGGQFSRTMRLNLSDGIVAIDLGNKERILL